MKTFQIVFAMLLASGVASAQQYVISTVIGIPQVRGYFGDGGVATSAQLNKPTQLTFDTKGNIYFIDYYNFAVRMVTVSTGNIITISGNGTQGWVDGVGEYHDCYRGLSTQARASVKSATPKGLAVDSLKQRLHWRYLGNCRIA